MARRLRSGTGTATLAVAIGVLLIAGITSVVRNADEVDDVEARRSAAGADESTGGDLEGGGPTERTPEATGPRPSAGLRAPAGDATVTTTPRSGAAPVGAASGGATDRGVTATSVKLGVLLVDVAGAARLGVNAPAVDPAQQREAFNAYLAAINEPGGVHGRKIEGVYRTFDILDAEDQRAACIELTEDRKVFAVVVIGGFGGSPNLCVTREHQTPLLALGDRGMPTDYYRQSEGRLFTWHQRSDRQMANWADEIHRSGVAEGQAIGILSEESGDPDGTIVKNELIPALKRHGYRIAQSSRLSADAATAASQMPIEVQRMRTQGAGVVLLAASFVPSTQFVQEADAQQWRPKWFASEFASMSSDAATRSMPRSFEGALALVSTRVGEWRDGKPEPPTDRACRELYEQRTGKAMPRSNGNSNNDAYALTMRACGLVEQFLGAIRAAGPTLTRDLFVASLESAGNVPLPSFGNGSFRRDKHDAADFVRWNRWKADCQCWRNVDEFRPSRY